MLTKFKFNALDSHEYKYLDTITNNQRLRRLLWEIVYRLFFRTTPRWALESWRRALLRLFGAKIGIGSRISPLCRIWAPWNLCIGEYTAIAEGVDCYTMERIEIGNHVSVSQRAYLCTGSHDISRLSRPLRNRPIRIEDHAWICAEAFIGPNVTIGEGSVVSARCCVFKDVEPWTVVTGNPAQVLRKRVVKL
jgi:putative colanic acid biosynthesis acetyltransferase WcaF